MRRPDFSKLEQLVKPLQRMDEAERSSLVRAVREDRLVNKLRQKQLQALAAEIGALDDDERQRILGN